MDMFFLLFIFLFFGIMILIGVYLKDQIISPLIDFFGTGSEAETVINTAAQVFNAMDAIFIFIYFMLSGTTIIFASMIRSRPIFLVINIIMLMILFVITPAFSNVMREFWSTQEFAQYAAGGEGSVEFTVMTRIFQYLPHVTMGISILVMIASFAKKETAAAYQ